MRACGIDASCDMAVHVQMDVQVDVITLIAIA